ncbi:hypothetical protein B0H67DRAFT_551171 [Lasiosphaeris hirsuta]|uniref:Uncharacterized protein n=1 Tax=Lasiosphaeris hirsuta TaxID=260670 RepID=A0AA40E5D8_9PEZI|nr:hypothetical protein B0H67DRAFT_551171 [Lasiosphaeris hirsuta]
MPKIKKFIDRTCSATGNSKLDIAVEMIAEENVQEKYIAPVVAELLSLGLKMDWEEIKDTVGRISDGYSQTKGYVTSLNLFRLGFDPDHDNPNTVYISVDYQCLETKWAPVLEDIWRYLVRRTAKNGRLDWALIMPHDAARIGENRPPEIQDWLDKYGGNPDADQNALPKQGTNEALLRQPPDTGLKEVLQESYVFKKGAISGVSAGKYSKTPADVAVHEDLHIAKGLQTPLSTELGYVHQGTVNQGHASLFARNGDSGSIVWDEEGRALGLVFTGQKVTGAKKHKLVYVTPLDEVFDDIKKFSGGRTTHIRIAE